MLLPTEPVGSIPRPFELIDALREFNDGTLSEDKLEPLYLAAIRDTIERFEATGSPVICDGEQRKFHNFATYAVHGAPNLAVDGFELKFVNHSQRFPRVTGGPFRYMRKADAFLDVARRFTTKPLKQAIIAPSCLSLFYPADDLEHFTRESYLESVVDECRREILACLAKGAATVQLDFTEGRLAHKLDPSGSLLNSFIGLNNLALRAVPPSERHRIGVHTCPGGDRDSTHSADVDYAELLPSLFELDAGSFFVALAREPDRPRVLRMIAEHLRPHQRVFVGVIDVLDPEIETPEQVCDRVMEAAEFIPLHQLGTTDDCGFSPFSDDTSTSRDSAFAKIRARVLGTQLASEKLAFAR
jgi:5-methyltetrahydropteroyltriglutamate--homocysteine methyltransferase